MGFGTLLTAVGAAGLEETLKGDGPFTIFAPTDSAFAKIPENTLKSILADKDLLSSILLRHVVPAAKFAKGVVWEFLDTAGGEQIATHVFKGGYTKVVSEVDGKRTKAKIIGENLGAVFIGKDIDDISDEVDHSIAGHDICAADSFTIDSDETVVVEFLHVDIDPEFGTFGRVHKSILLCGS